MITAPTADTIEGWAKLSALASGTIVDHVGSGALTSFGFRQTTTPTTIYWVRSAGVRVWHHVGTWSSADNTSRLYVDGVSAGHRHEHG